MWIALLSNRYVQAAGALGLGVLAFLMWLARHDSEIEDEVEDRILDKVRDEQKEISDTGREVLELKLGKIRNEPIEVVEQEPIEVVERNSDSMPSARELRESDPRLASILFD